MPCFPNSLPDPLCLMPPKGVMLLGMKAVLTPTVPASIKPDTRSAREMELVYSVAVHPPTSVQHKWKQEGLKHTGQAV